jgi:hypothetical protein
MNQYNTSPSPLYCDIILTLADSYMNKNGKRTFLSCFEVCFYLYYNVMYDKNVKFTHKKAKTLDRLVEFFKYIYRTVRVQPVFIALRSAVSLVEQELLTLPEHLRSPPVFSGVYVTRSLALYVCFVCL